MKQKSSRLLGVGVLSLILLVSLVVAIVDTPFTVDKNSVTFTRGVSSQTFTLENKDVSNALNLDFPSTVLVNGVTFDITGDSTIPANGSKVLTVAPSSPIDFSNFDFLDTFSNSFVVSETGNSTNSKTITVNMNNNDYCEFDNLGSNLRLDIDNIDVKGFSDDDEEWYPLDEIEIDVNVDNNGNDKIKNIEIEWILATASGDNIFDGDEKDFDLKDGKDDTVTISFQLDPDDVDDNTENYRLYVRATGEDEEFDGNDTCESDFQDIKIVLTDDFVVLDDISFSESVRPGQELQITADVWNIGTDDQDEVMVRVFIPEFDISEKVEVGDINSLDSEPLDLTITIPNNAEEGLHTIRFEVYDEDNDIYESEDDEESKFSEVVRVEGSSTGGSSSGSGSGSSGSGNSGARAVVSASLDSGGKAGEELVVRVSVKNPGSGLTAYSLGAAGYGSWASSADLSQTSLLLNEGQSQDVLVTFEVDSDASGDKTFEFEVLADNRLVVSQPVSVSIEGGRAGITGGVVGINSDNWYLWGIGLLNIILVIIIIIVAVRVARR